MCRIASFNSDFDMCLVTNDCQSLRTISMISRRVSFNALNQLWSLITRVASDKIVSKMFLSKSRVPLITLEIQWFSFPLHVDITCNRVDERFPMIMLVVKHWAISAGINSAFEGTLGSFSLALMVIHYLQCGVHPPVLPHLFRLFPDVFNADIPVSYLTDSNHLSDLRGFACWNKDTVGELLRGFFEYYAYRVNFDTKIVSVRHCCLYDRPKGFNDGNYIFVEGPFGNENTAHNVRDHRNFMKIIHAFRTAAQLSRYFSLDVLLSEERYTTKEAGT
ncbi:unnamed protein product [Soboliphyme baturini]|uniref:PAP-associated domain-containing protein n=1 Tax=Soboliphyme baturini TaxID=241478 RepID=A0A183J6B8_9BILA|nr:unnamed protein product [Soboliphyme baturini]